MNKGLKFTLISIGILILIILGIMIIVPLFFKDKIRETVVKLANENVDAKVNIDDFGLNFFSNFPNATLSLKNTSVVGKDQFEGDTLLSAKDISVTIDLGSIFGDNYIIRNLEVNQTDINAIVAKDGNANWDILPEDENKKSETKDDKESNFNLSLKNIQIKNLNIKYDDRESKILGVLNDLNAKISGDFSSKETSLSTNLKINGIDLTMEGIPMMRKIALSTITNIHADFENEKYSISNAKIYLNDLLTEIDGSVQLLNEDDMDLDIRLTTPNATFKQILSLVPAMYNNELKTIKTDGKISLDAYVVGTMSETKMPTLNLNLNIADAMFRYPSLPKAVEDINVLLSVNGDLSNTDNLQINLNKLGFRIDDNKIAAKLHINPIKNDQTINSEIVGSLNLGIIKDVYPLPKETSINGIINTNININTTKSAVTAERYNEVNAKGTFKLSDMDYKSADFLDVAIKLLDLDFTSNSAKLNNLDIVLGKSDFKANGYVQNILGYVFNEQTIVGVLNLSSENIDMDELMSHVEEDEEELGKIVIPTNIDFTLTSNLENIKFGNMDITNTAGNIKVKDGVLTLNKLSAGVLGGVTTMDAKYNSVPFDPQLNASFNLAGATFADTFKSIETVQRIAPIFSDIEGVYSLNMTFSATLYEEQNKTLKSIDANGTLMTNNLKLKSNEVLAKLGSLLKSNQLDNITAKDVNIQFTIKDGNVITRPFDVKFGDGGILNLQGATSLDQSIDYKGTVTLPQSMDNKILSKIPLVITGTFANPKISIDTKSVATDALDKLAGGLLGKDEGATEAVKEKINEEKEKKIEEIRKATNETIDKMTSTAKEQADALVEKAGSNALAKAAAKKAADEIIKKAEKESQKLKDKSEEQIKKLEDEE